MEPKISNIKISLRDSKKVVTKIFKDLNFLYNFLAARQKEGFIIKSNESIMLCVKLVYKILSS